MGLLSQEVVAQNESREDFEVDLARGEREQFGVGEGDQALVDVRSAQVFAGSQGHREPKPLRSGACASFFSSRSFPPQPSP
jgi:3-mercaptopyruvate sulfurtransferase SseA